MNPQFQMVLMRKNIIFHDTVIALLQLYTNLVVVKVV